MCPLRLMQQEFYQPQTEEDKCLVDCTCQFKAATKVMESHIGGDLVLPKLVKLDPKYMDNYDPTKDPPDLAPKECPKRAHKRLSTYLHMEIVDQTKCGSLLTALSSQCSLGNDQYPDQLEKTTNILSNHKFDQLYYNTKSKKAAKEKADKDRQRELARN